MGRIGAVAALGGALSWGIAAEALENIDFAAPGASEQLERRLKNASLLMEVGTETDDVQEILAAARAEYARLLGVLYDEGHFGGVISILVDGREAANLSPLTPPPSISRIQVTVQPGPTYRFSRAEVDPLARGTDLPAGFRVGETAKVPAIRGAVGAAVQGWRDAGYAKADVAGQSIVARHVEETVDASVQVTTGPRVTFGPFRVTGNENVRESAIRRIAGFPEGERFSPARMEQSAKRLRDTGAFRSVSMVEANDLQPGAVMPVTATIIEQLPRRFGFGAEIDSSDGLKASAYWMHRNLFGGAEQLRVDGEIEGIGADLGGGQSDGFAGQDFTFGVSFVRPATLNPDTDLVLSAFISDQNEPDYSSKSIEFGAGFSRNIRDLYTADYGIGYVYSRDEDDSGVTEYSLLTLPLGVMGDFRDNPLNPTRGWFGNLNLTPFAGLNDASGSGARLIADARIYRGFGEFGEFGQSDRFIAAGRLQLGSIMGAELTQVPNDWRFYSGGGGTVRGQDYENLGVTLPDGQQSGGASFVGASMEARIGVTEKIQGVGFFDYGYIGEDSFPNDTGGDEAGAGLGIRYITPIGPIRLDVAVPVFGPEDTSSFQFYVGIGQAF